MADVSLFLIVSKKHMPFAVNKRIYLLTCFYILFPYDPIRPSKSTLCDLPLPFPLLGSFHFSNYKYRYASSNAVLISRFPFSYFPSERSAKSSTISSSRLTLLSLLASEILHVLCGFGKKDTKSPPFVFHSYLANISF